MDVQVAQERVTELKALPKAAVDRFLAKFQVRRVRDLPANQVEDARALLKDMEVEFRQPGAGSAGCKRQDAVPHPREAWELADILFDSDELRDRRPSAGFSSLTEEIYACLRETWATLVKTERELAEARQLLSQPVAQCAMQLWVLLTTHDQLAVMRCGGDFVAWSAGFVKRLDYVPGTEVWLSPSPLAAAVEAVAKAKSLKETKDAGYGI